MPFVAGSRLGPYEILSPVGTGAMGEVYRARHLRLGREVAIKVLPERLACDAEARARFEREANAVAALSHPNIMAIYDFVTEQGVSFAVMELLEGETLGSRLARAPLPWRKAVEIGMDVAGGLAAAHAKGIVHRDLKPENIFLTADGHAKILDFGLARSTPVDPQRDLTTLTGPGLVVGTVGYMSPEQVRGLPADPASDIFSFGCVLYEMVAGCRPFARTTAADTISAILNDDPPEIGGSSRTLPAHLAQVIRHCLEKKPAERFQSARDLAFALKAISMHAESSDPALAAAKPRFRPALLAPLAPVVLLFVAWGYLRAGRANEIHSLAVLPIMSEGADPETQYLGERITESLINRLSQLPNLKVKSRQSVLRYRGRDPDAQQVGKELGVEAVLMGRILRRGENLWISAELLNARDNDQIWGEQYSRKPADLLAVQEELFGDVLARLRLRLNRDERNQLEAYRLYLKGRHYWNTRTPTGLRKSVQYFEEAIQRQPDHALAYAGLADSYNMLVLYGAMPPREAFPKAKAAAEKALRLDDSLAQAHAALALIKHRFDLDWAGSEMEFNQAIEIGGYGPARQWYSSYLVTMGRKDEAIAEVKRAQDLDPLSLIVSSHLGWIYYFVRRYDETIEECRRTLDLDPSFFAARRYLGMAYERKGMYEEAIAEFQKAIVLSGGSTLMKATLGHAFATAGQTAEARQVLAELEGASRSGYVSPYLTAMIHAGLGEKEAAFQWLEVAYQERSDWIVYLKVDPRFDGLRPDSRFADLLRRIGLST